MTTSTNPNQGLRDKVSPRRIKRRVQDQITLAGLRLREANLKGKAKAVLPDRKTLLYLGGLGAAGGLVVGLNRERLRAMRAKESVVTNLVTAVDGSLGQLRHFDDCPDQVIAALETALAVYHDGSLLGAAVEAASMVRDNDRLPARV
jgi:hypothetical protein